MAIFGNRVQVAIHSCFGAPVFQEHLHLHGLVTTTIPFAGTTEVGLTDDFGNLLNWATNGMVQGVAFLCDSYYL